MAYFFSGWIRRLGLVGIGLILSLTALGHDSQEMESEELHAVLEAGKREELVRYLDEREKTFVREAEFWRALLPEFGSHGMLDVAGERLGESWKKGADRAEVLFALAELRLFEGEIEEAKDLFWRVFAMSEEGEERGARGFFQRLNFAFHDRFGAKYRIGEATGRFGTRMCLEFTFLGLRENVRVTDASQARTAALLYLKELEMPELSSAEFLDRVAAALEKVDRPAAQRMFAYAVVGAPRTLVGEVESFLAQPGTDTVGAEFSLLSMNRFVLSTGKFPDLRERMLAAARQVPEKLEADAPEEVRAGVEEMRARILRRLGEATQASAPEPGSPEEHFHRISTAVESGNPEEGERIFREIEAAGKASEGFERALLYLSGAWGEAGNVGRAAALAVEYLERLYPDGRGAGLVSAPVEWQPQSPFPPENRVLGFEIVESVNEVFSMMHRKEIWPVFKETMASRGKELAAEDRLAGCLVELSFLWWAEEREEAVRAAEAWAAAIENSDADLLWAHLLGRMENYEAARAVLGGLGGTADSAAERLRFAFAVAEKDGERAMASAERLANANLSAEERLQVGFGLMLVGFPEAGGRWVENLGSGVRQSERLHQVELRAAQEKGNEEKATVTATRILVAEVPFSFGDLLSPARATALTILEENGELERYEQGFRESLLFVPDALGHLLLLGEAAEFRWTHLKEAAAKPEAIEWYKKAMEAASDEVEARLNFAEWAIARDLNDLAVEMFNAVLPVDAQAALLDSSLLFAAYREAGRLADLVVFLEEWRAPDAESIDDFYGLQPTEHLFRPLGEALLEEGDEEFAERAWRKGLTMNPLTFTEEIRLRLVEFYLTRNRGAEAVTAMKPYFAARDPDPELYATHPFVETLPRWMSGLRTENPERSATTRLLRMVAEAGGEPELLAAAENWEKEFPERFSAAAFRVYLLARMGREDWRSAAENVRERFAKEGAMIPMREAAEEIWEAAANRKEN